MGSREELIEVFEDTQRWYKEDAELAAAVKDSIAGTVVYDADNYPTLPKSAQAQKMNVCVTKSRTFEAAMRLRKKYPDKRIAVHNFASATNPGGGVTRGSRAQEECLCRCSTLYPTLTTPDLWEKYYRFHRNRHDVRYTDTCIYTPGVWIIKTDENAPQRMQKQDWCKVDVMTCAAPNLRANPYNVMNPGSGEAVQLTDEELLKLHQKRARHMLSVAAANGAEVLVLGAFGCGAFQNKPEVVAEAYQEVLKEFAGRFAEVEFAVYCTPRDQKNYEAFRRIIRK